MVGGCNILFLSGGFILLSEVYVIKKMQPSESKKITTGRRREPWRRLWSMLSVVLFLLFSLLRLLIKKTKNKTRALTGRRRDAVGRSVPFLSHFSIICISLEAIFFCIYFLIAQGNKYSSIR